MPLRIEADQGSLNAPLQRPIGTAGFLPGHQLTLTNQQCADPQHEMPVGRLKVFSGIKCLRLTVIHAGASAKHSG